MIFKTRGIVFHRIKYSESSIIAKIYTEQFGLCSFLVQGARKKTSAAKANLLQPLSLVELVAYHKETSGLQKMKELKNDHPLISIQNNIVKTTIAIFLSEMLVRSIREETPNKQLFSFLHQSIIFFDKLENPVNFHLLFLIKLSKFLGFFPQANSMKPRKNVEVGIPVLSEKNTAHIDSPSLTFLEPPVTYQPVQYINSGRSMEEALFFDLTEGIFEKEKPNHPNFLSCDASNIFRQLISMDFGDLKSFSIAGKDRRTLLEKIIDYYRLHLTGFQEIKSHQVLEMVLNG